MISTFRSGNPCAHAGGLRTTAWHGAAVVMALCWLTGCSTERTAVDAVHLQEVAIWEGGGFAGLYSGYTLTGEGTITRWEGRSPVESSRVIGHLSREALSHVHATIDAAEFFSMPDFESGNYTRWIRVVAAADTHVVRWPAGPLEADAAREAKSLYDRLSHLFTGGT